MAEYRSYTFTAKGHISNPLPTLECNDDVEAIKKAKQKFDGIFVLEVWPRTSVPASLPHHAGGHLRSIDAATCPKRNLAR
jgi:hypothetical protein